MSYERAGFRLDTIILYCSALPKSIAVECVLNYDHIKIYCSIQFPTSKSHQYNEGYIVGLACLVYRTVLYCTVLNLYTTLVPVQLLCVLTPKNNLQSLDLASLSIVSMRLKGRDSTVSDYS